MLSRSFFAQFFSVQWSLDRQGVGSLGKADVYQCRDGPGKKKDKVGDNVPKHPLETMFWDVIGNFLTEKVPKYKIVDIKNIFLRGTADDW